MNEDVLQTNAKGAKCVVMLSFYEDSEIAIKSPLPVKEVLKCLQTIYTELMYRDITTTVKQKLLADQRIIIPQMSLTNNLQ